MEDAHEEGEKKKKKEGRGSIGIFGQEGFDVGSPGHVLGRFLLLGYDVGDIIN